MSVVGDGTGHGDGTERGDGAGYGDGTEHGGGSADEPGWDVDPDDESGVAVVAAVGRQIKAWREAAGMRACELGAQMGYGEDLVYKVEGGRRIPRPEFLDRADAVLGAGGKLAAMKPDVAEVRYPKKIRELAKLEARAVELLAYSNSSVHGLLQTTEYARALFAMRQPAYSQDEIERAVAARMARQIIFERSPAPTLGFVLEELVLRRPLGGKVVLRRQLEHLLVIGKLRNVTVQVMPIGREEHAGIGGLIQLLKFKDGTAVGRSDGAFGGRPVSDPKQIRILELRSGMIRAQALTPRESMAFVEQVLGET
ncbi:helix-turn-helix domain-containing protein [Streptomyces sp. NBC_00654]|uniref:helix-turn-helix domain-containing protein n=1 Tax=Streptomyces sp. NBC_00654 TaxID=2975799 RepID=UPI00225351C3|nr:helix-turn-helix transcriptional regulator [Streptomyces sp. NBC_00654]MCX4969905.1 helix-turn-helix domain-containing protein [Streptomyces sp. NBC_00654]